MSARWTALLGGKPRDGEKKKKLLRKAKPEQKNKI
jgi:hypothetical protein